MIPKIAEKPTMVIAGPGAGKTHDMVNKILDAIPDLKPNRILAAITFTNAATDSIKERLLLLRPFNGSHITRPGSSFSKGSFPMMGTILWPE